MMYLSENLSPQGTKLGPWLFLTVIKDLVVKNARLWKYVDNTISYTIIMIPYILLLYAIEVVDSVKLLGLNISSDLTWNIYINETVKKGSKRLYIFWYNLRELRLLALIQGSSTLVVLDQLWAMYYRPFTSVCLNI